LCRVVRSWKTRMWMRLTERVREFIPKAGCRMLKRTVCNFERWGGRWSGYGDNGRGFSTARRLNSDQFRKIRRLRCSKNFINEREKLVLNTSRTRSASLFSAQITVSQFLASRLAYYHTCTAVIINLFTVLLTQAMRAFRVRTERRQVSLTFLFSRFYIDN